MIGKLTGTIDFLGETFAIVDVSGVGYKVFLTGPTLDELRRNNILQASFFTYLSVRETALDLYGFRELAELELFEMLIGVSGIGPKSALAILGLTTIEILRSAISAGETAYLTKVSGIGRKSAEKIILELRDKVGGDRSDGHGLKEEAEALEALQALGYSTREARDALKKVGAENVTLNEKVKKALQILSGR